MLDLTVLEDRHACGPSAQIHQRAPQLALLFGQHRERRRQRLEHEAGNTVTRSLHRFAQVLSRGGLNRDEVHLYLQPQPGHALRIADAVLIVDPVLLRNGVKQLTVLPEADRRSNLVDPLDVRARDLLGRHRGQSGRRAHLDMLPCNAAVDTGYLHPGHPLGVVHRAHD